MSDHVGSNQWFIWIDFSFITLILYHRKLNRRAGSIKLFKNNNDDGVGNEIFSELGTAFSAFRLGVYIVGAALALLIVQVR